VLTLTSERGIRVELLDPRADVARLGARYCSGGYVWQVWDERHGALFAGPCFPAPEPPPFDGQGAPEVFELGLGQHEARLGDDVYVIGVGRVRRESTVRPFHVRDNPNVVERAVWDISETAASTLRFRSSALFGEFALTLERTVSLDGRAMTSATTVRNVGRRELPLRWFAHPFFPWAGERCFRSSLELALPDGVALVEDAEGFVARRPGSDWTRGNYVVPRVALGGELRVDQCHPALACVRVACRFSLGGLALWGNEHTFSFEPFLQTNVAAGGVTTWSITYEF
jgi:hypothetical protein